MKFILAILLGVVGQLLVAGIAWALLPIATADTFAPTYWQALAGVVLLNLTSSAFTK